MNYWNLIIWSDGVSTKTFQVSYNVPGVYINPSEGFIEAGGPILPIELKWNGPEILPKKPGNTLAIEYCNVSSYKKRKKCK